MMGEIVLSWNSSGESFDQYHCLQVRLSFADSKVVFDVSEGDYHVRTTGFRLCGDAFDSMPGADSRLCSYSPLREGSFGQL